MASSKGNICEGEYERVEKKAFTHWINSHLQNVIPKVTDLYKDLRDGHQLCMLIEQLTGEKVYCEQGDTVHHKMQNVQNVLDYLTTNRKIKLVNIRSTDIVNGKATPTLGLVWMLILHFQISGKQYLRRDGDSTMLKDMSTAKLTNGLLEWVQAITDGYDGVKITNFHTSWRDGLAFCAILDRFRPDLIIYDDCDPDNPLLNLETAMTVAEKELGITRIIDPKDVFVENPEEKAIMTYVSSLHNAFSDMALPPCHRMGPLESLSDYNELFVATREWVLEKTIQVTGRNFPNTVIDMKTTMSAFHAYMTRDLLLKKRDMSTLKKTYHQLQEQADDKNTPSVPKEMSFDLLLAEWGQLERENKECAAAMERELARLKKLEVHSSLDSTSNDQTDGAVKEGGACDKLQDGDSVNELNCTTVSVRNDWEMLDSLIKDVLEELNEPSVHTQELASIGAHPFSQYSHHHFDDNFPNMCFLGEPLKFSVESKPLYISLPGINVSLRIPRNAVPPNKKVNVTFGACLSGSFKYPEGYEPLSAVYLISVDSSFDKEVELTFEHFAEIENEIQASKLKCFSAKSSLANGEKEYEFHQMVGAKLAVDKTRCKLTTQHFCEIVVAAEHDELKKRYGAVCSYEINDEVSHAAVAVSMVNSGYIENFRNSLQERWGMSAQLCHISMRKVSFKEPGSEARALVKFPQYVSGWSVEPDSTPCFFQQEDVNDLSADKSMIDYPPRFIFNISPDAKAQPCTLKLQLTEMSQDINFQIKLAPTHSSPSHSSLPAPPDSMPLTHRAGLDDVVDDKGLATIARDHLIQWESLSPYLELSRAQKVVIDRSGDYGMQKQECLSVWRQNLGNKATYRALIQAAEEAKLQSLADKVKNMVTPLPAAGSCDNDSTSEWQENQRRLVGMLDELCELIACAEATVLATEGSPPDNDKETLEAQVAECETFHEKMASHLSNVNMLMKVAEESEKDTPSIIGHNMTGGITDVSMRWWCLWSRLSSWHCQLLEALANISKRSFNFAKWRTKLQQWVTQEKLAVTDWFHKFDSNKDGVLTREEFIKGLEASDVALSQTEMENITDHFDPDGDGCINISEMDSILSGLHTEQPLTKPSASKCNKRDCEVRSEVHECSENVKAIRRQRRKYGVSTRYITTGGKISMVRITNGKVSVRIGGGWEPLEEFLSRRNPDQYQFHDTKPIKKKRANSLTKKVHTGTAKVTTQKMRKISRQTSQMSSVSRIPRFVPMAGGKKVKKKASFSEANTTTTT